MNKFILITIILLVITSTFGQGFYEIEQNFKLFKSGKKKVSILRDSELISFKIIDSTNRIIIENTVQRSEILSNKHSPKYNNFLSISVIEKSFYNAKGIIDSILILGYSYPTITLSGENVPAYVDSTVIVYGRTLLGKKILTRNCYSIDQGVRRLYRIDHYGYDNNDRLIILIEGDGHTQFYFEYNVYGNISTYNVFGTKVNFEYDKFGRKSKDIYGSSINTYKYGNDSLLIEKNTLGKSEGIYIYKYE